ncbi:uncharacterized protein LOC119292689 [Triticum dicoccoides]|uniref:uncharacterized protein LOC119292689 n=1 Tax=Triticum dicoccoides TaxID=85692 RepID=UPI00188ECF7B|nr:uncharacterized protein LOC119292689 [Triticum dicoccoides]
MEPHGTKWVASPAFRSGPLPQLASWITKGLDWGLLDEVQILQSRIRDLIKKDIDLVKLGLSLPPPFDQGQELPSPTDLAERGLGLATPVVAVARSGRRIRRRADRRWALELIQQLVVDQEASTSTATARGRPPSIHVVVPLLFLSRLAGATGAGRRATDSQHPVEHHHTLRNFMATRSPGVTIFFINWGYGDVQVFLNRVED